MIYALVATILNLVPRIRDTVPCIRDTVPTKFSLISYQKVSKVLAVDQMR